MNEQWIEKLRNNPLIGQLSKEKMENLIPSLHWLEQRYPKGKLAAFRGDSLDRMMFLTRGQLSAEISSMKGKTLKVETLTAPALIAGPLIFADENNLPVQLTAETDVEILSLSLEDSLHLLSSDPALLQQFLKDCGNKVTFLSGKIRLLQFSSLREKIAVYLLDLQNKQKSGHVVLPLKMEVLAELFSVARPSLSRSFSELVGGRIPGTGGQRVLHP